MTGVTVALLRSKTPPDRAALATHRVTYVLRLAPAGPEADKVKARIEELRKPA